MSEPSFPRYVNWRSDVMQTDDAKADVAAFSQWAFETGRAHDSHDPEFLMCLDKGDIVSRYLLLLMQKESNERELRESTRAELTRMRELTGAAGSWWNRCVVAVRSGRKTIRLDGMGLT